MGSDPIDALSTPALSATRIEGAAAGARARRPWRIALAGAFCMLLVLTQLPAAAADEPRLWDALRSGQHLVLLRHAIAPGTDDPPEFQLGDCSSQRNLSEDGRIQAAAIGDRFRANGIETARVFSSQWCRCLDTARLLGLGEVSELPALNSFFRHPERQRQQTQELTAWLGGQPLEQPLVLVTHQVNITALSGVYPASGELVVVRRMPNGELKPIGKLETD